jgi:hypothetical protein
MYSDFIKRFKWHIVIIVVIVIPVVLWNVLGSPASMRYFVGPPVLLVIGSTLLLSAAILILLRISNIVDTLKDNSSKLEDVTRVLERISDGLKEIGQYTRLSETAKAIAFRDAERASLQEAVSQKLNQREFEAAYDIIDEIALRPEYSDLADELRGQADKHRNTVRNKRIEEIISQIDELLDQHQWSKASVQIEGLINAFPDSERARAMRQRLYNKKEQHKKELLSQWDAAVQRQDTDKSLNILKELDHYLTPNEALALQEAAKDVFRTKLHNLGVRFSMAVSDRNWTEALDIGQQIIADFPNSRMSEEIRAKLDVLKQNVQM